VLRHLYRHSPYVGKEGVGCAQARARWLRKTVDGTFGPIACQVISRDMSRGRCAALRLGADSALRSALRDDLLPIRRRPTRSMRAMRADGGVILQLDVTARSWFKGLVNMESMRFSIGMLIRNAKLIIEQTGRTSLQRQQRKHTTSGYATLPFRINRRCHTAADY
jgi:hypothetical protein